MCFVRVDKHLYFQIVNAHWRSPDHRIFFSLRPAPSPLAPVPFFAGAPAGRVTRESRFIYFDFYHAGIDMKMIYS